MTIDLARHLAKHAPFNIVALKDAQHCYADFRAADGESANWPRLMSWPTDNVKLAKGLKIGVAEYGLCLAPADHSLIYNACRYFSDNCKDGCVAFAGHGELPKVLRARARKTRFLAEHPDEFITLLMHELEGISNRHDVAQSRVRLNNFSDLPWEKLCPDIFASFPRMRFYDYTKWGQRAIDANLGFYSWPGNYRLTFSASERTLDEDIVHMVENGINVATLFAVKKDAPLPSVWKGAQVIDGDVHDDRWMDPAFVIVGLRAKGRMRKGNWPMVRKLEAA